MALIAALPVRSVEELHRLLAAHVRDCVDDLHRTPGPTIYRAGVRYRVEPPGEERWQLPSETRAVGYGDCEDLASYRTADLIFSGEDPGASVWTYQSAPGVRHCIVLRSNGTKEDPSRQLGMGSERDLSERAELRAGLGGDAMPAADPGVRWSVSKLPHGGWQGEVILLLDPALRRRLNLEGDAEPHCAAGVAVRARGVTKGDAATRTMAAVSTVISSPLVQAMMPPGTMLALKSAQAVAKLFRGLFKKRKRRRTVSGLDVTPRYVAGALVRRGMRPEMARFAEVCGEW